MFTEAETRLDTFLGSLSGLCLINVEFLNELAYFNVQRIKFMHICMYSTFLDKALLGKKVFLVSYNAVEFLSNK